MGDYIIPKDATFMPGLYFIMYDPEHFKNPDVFNPDRFIDPGSGKFIPDERVIPFGIGKRNCLGSQMGEKQLFLGFSGFMQTFKVSPPPNGKLPDYTIYKASPRSMIRSSPFFDVLVTERQ